MSYRILIVDDDPEFRQELCECLHHYHVIEATNGQQALDIIKNPHAIDLVILDIVLPGMTGVEVLRQIKKTAPALAVIMLTGQSSKDAVIGSLKGHADDYIEKPFEIDKLLGTIHKILDSKNQNLTAHINKMQRVRLFIERNVDKKVSLKHAAEEVCLSPKYLSRLFKENTGIGFNEYRLKIKMQKAVKELQESGCKIDDLAVQLGYKNPESFIRIFEKLMGTTPARYRQKHKGQKRKNA